VIFYELADHSVREAIDFYGTGEEAFEALEQVLEYEPAWAGVLEVVEVGLGSTSEN
jgi:hypothetical protein